MLTVFVDDIIVVAKNDHEHLENSQMKAIPLIFDQQRWFEEGS
jgi:hypothetical protein